MVMILESYIESQINKIFPKAQKIFGRASRLVLYPRYRVSEKGLAV